MSILDQLPLPAGLPGQSTPYVPNPSVTPIPTPNTVTTSQGDVWDMLSFRAYGSEFYSNILLDANPSYNDITIFDGGIVLQAPPPPQLQSLPLPPWRQGTVLVPSRSG